MMVILFRCLTQYVMQMQNFIFASSLCTRVFFFPEILLSHLKVHIFQEYIVKYIYNNISSRMLPSVGKFSIRATAAVSILFFIMDSPKGIAFPPLF